jgi:hypothetical protein
MAVQFLIAPPGATSITVTFTAFDLGAAANNNDQLSLFAVNNSTYTPLATYLGDNLPNNGQAITFQTQALALFFFADHQDNFPGFAMIWEANGIANPPVASFTANATDVHGPGTSGMGIPQMSKTRVMFTRKPAPTALS